MARCASLLCLSVWACVSGLKSRHARMQVESGSVVTALLILLCGLASLDLWRQYAINSADYWYSRYTAAVGSDDSFWKLGYRIEELEVRGASSDILPQAPFSRPPLTPCFSSLHLSISLCLSYNSRYPNVPLERRAACSRVSRASLSPRPFLPAQDPARLCPHTSHARRHARPAA